MNRREPFRKLAVAPVAVALGVPLERELNDRMVIYEHLRDQQRL